MTTLPNIGLVLPTRGPSGAGTWDDTLDSDLGLLDEHDHTTGKGQPINTAAIAIDADLSFSSLWAPTNLHRIQFASVVGFSGNNKSLFVSLDNELYWRSNAGANVQITTGSTLNVAAFTGGIGGDYAAVGAAVAYDDAGDRYTFKQQSPGNWARMASGEVRIFETGTTESVFVGLAAPAALASSITLTLPLVLPANLTIMQMSSAGVISASTMTLPSTTSYVTMSSAGVLGTTAISVTHQHHSMLAFLADATATKIPGLVGSTTGRIQLNTSVAEHILPLTVPIPGTITGFSVSVFKSSAAGTISARLMEGLGNSTTGAPTQIGSTQSNSANNPGSISLAQSGLSHVAVDGREYYIAINGGGTSGDSVFGYNVKVTPQ